LDGPTTPTWLALCADPDRLRERCIALSNAVGGKVVASAGAVGGGGAPGLELPGWAVAVPATLAEPLRRGTPPVITRTDHDRCLIDLRCIDEADDATLRDAALAAVLP
jgi:L-seryl-tRNA(Ser) seleniumtransferase